MKTTLTNSFKLILSDRLLTILIGLFLLVCIAYCVYVGISLRPSDLQVAVHYTAYGETNFYRDKWYYLLSFIAFGVIIAISHAALTAKIYMQGRRQLALLFLGLSFLLMVIAWSVTWSILRIAFL